MRVSTIPHVENRTPTDRRGRRPRPPVRSRWAAIGAAVAVTLGAGGLTIATASGSGSSFVPVTPERVLDTRTGVGLSGPFTSPTGRTLQVTGSIPTASGPGTVVPTGATAVVLNVTAVQPQADGFLAVRPDGTPGDPQTSNLNFTAGDIVPNAVVVGLPASGAVDIVYDAFGVVGPVTDVLIDVTGYYVAGGAGGSGPPGATGPTGETGETGQQGPAGADAPRPAGVITVAKSGGDHTSVQGALDSIGTTLPAASATNRYVIEIAPGTYTGVVTMNKSFVDLEGSGESTTILTSAGGGTLASSGTLRSGNVTVEVRNLSVVNTGGNTHGTAIYNIASTSSLRFSNVTAIASGSSSGNFGVYNAASSPLMNHMTISASGAGNRGVVNAGSVASPLIRDSTISGTESIRNETSAAADVYNTILSPSAQQQNAGFRCRNVVNAGLDPLGNDCRL